LQSFFSRGRNVLGFVKKTSNEYEYWRCTVWRQINSLHTWCWFCVGQVTEYVKERILALREQYKGQVMSFFSSISGYGYFLSIVYKREEAFFDKN